MDSVNKMDSSPFTTESKDVLRPSFEITDKESEELRQAFNMFDKDGTGTIPAEEIRVALTVLGFNPTFEEVQELLARHDEGKNGLLSFDEFTNIIIDKVSELRPEADLIRAFHELDKDNDGGISLGDLEETSEFLGEKLSKDELREIIMCARGMSKDFDIHTKDVGVITQSQFINVMEKNWN